MTWLRRGATILALIGILSQNAAQAATYYYFRGGATAQTTASAPPPPNSTGTFAILVDGPSVATRGASYSATTYPYYNVGAVSYSILSGSLPAGISLNPSTGTISGSPTVNGQTQAVIQAIDAGTSKTATASFTLDVVDPFGISGNPGTAVNVGTAYSTTFFAFGGTQPYQFSSTGLPPGLSATSSATSTTISGNPSAAGSYNITVTGTDANGLTAAYPYTLSVIGALTIAGTPPATGNVGTPYTGSVAASGGTGPYTYALAAGSLPAGVTLKTATGIISGTPTLAQSKTGIRIKVTDSTGATFTSNAFSITIAAVQALAISGNPPTTVQEGASYSAQYGASGGVQPYTFSLLSGSLPTGLSLDPSSGLISGVPATGSHGTYTFTVKVADNAGHSTNASPVTLTVSTVPLAIAGGRNETIERDVAFSKTYSASGGAGPYVYALSGSFPPGLSLDHATGTLSGSPTAYGTYPGLQIQVTDALGATASTVTFALTVISASPLQLLGNPATSVLRGMPYAAEFDAYDGSGTGYSFASAGSALPDGLALVNNGATSVLLAGTPTQAGNYSGLQLKVTDSLGNIAYSISFTITVDAPAPADPLSILGNAPQATLGQPYSTQFGAGGGAPPYSYVLTGALPDGLSFDAATATISGTPTRAGSWDNIQVTVTDSTSGTASTAPFSIVVVDSNPLTITWSPQTSWSVGDTLTAVPTVSGGNSGSYVFGYTGTLPSAVTQYPDGSISGALTTTGTWGPITLTVTDGVRNASTNAVTFTVGNPPLSITSSISGVASEGYAYESDFFARGGAGSGYVFSLAQGTLPTGLSLNSTTGVISGVPGTGTAGNYDNLVVQVADGTSTAQSDPFSIFVMAATADASLITASPTRAGSAILGNLSTSLANPSWSFNQSPANPSLSLAASGSSFSGVAPNVASSTTFTITATASDNGDNVSAPPLSLTVLPLLTIANAPSGAQNGVLGNAFGPTQAPSASGVVGNRSFALVQFGTSFDIATACPGLSFNASNATIAGTPTATCSVSNLVIRLSDDFDGDAVDSDPTFGITIAGGTATASLSSPATVRVGAPVSGALTTNLSSPTWSFAQAPATPSLGLAASGNTASATFSAVAPTVASQTAFTITATATAGSATSQTNSVQVNVVPALTLAGGPSGTVVGTVGQAVSTTVAPTKANAIGAVSYALLQGGAAADITALCPGLTFSSSNGTVSGSPSASCYAAGLTIQGTDAFDGSSAATPTPFALSMASALAFGGSPSDAAQGTGYSFDLASLVSGGRAPYAFTIVSGSLPAGMSLSGSVVSAVSVTGTTSAASIKVTDADGRSSTASLTFNVTAGTASASLTSPSTVRQGATIAGTLTSSFASPTWSMSQLPASPSLGLSASGATFSGAAPTVASQTTFTIKASATQGGSTANAGGVPVTVVPALAIAGGPSGTAVGTVGGAQSLAVPTLTNLMGSASFDLRQTGASADISTLCAGLTFSSANGRIAGTPSAACYVTGLTILATDSSDSSTAETATPFAISMQPALAFAGTPSTADQGTAYSFDLATLVTGGRAPYGFAITAGALPAGMSLSGSVVTATSVTGSSSTASVKVTDADGRTVTTPLTFTVNGATASASLTSPATVHPGAAIAGTLSASYASPTWSFAQSPTSPLLGLSASGVTFAGTAPVVATSTTFSITPTASQGGTTANASAVTVTVKPSLAIAGGPSGALNGTTGTPVTGAVATTSNAIGAVSYALLKAGTAYNALGTDCVGLSFSTTDGGISGTPNAPCSVTGLTIRATDALDSTTATTATPFNLNVTDPALVLSGSPAGATYGQAYSFQLTASGGSNAGYVFSLASGALPAGLSLSASGLISGTPSDLTGKSGIVVAVTDSRSNTAQSAPFAIAITDPSPIVISWSPSTSLIGGQAVSFPVTISGGNPANYAFSNGGTAVAGLTVDATTGTLSGTMPTAAGSYGPVKIVVTDGLRTVSTTAVTFTVAAPTASATLTSSVVARTGTAIAGTLTTNVPSPTWSFALTPSSPNLGLAAAGTTFAGTAPTVSAPTAYSIVATATNGASTASAAPLALTVAPVFTVAGGAASDINGLTGTPIAATPAVTFNNTNVSSTPTFTVLQGSTVYDVAANCGLTLDSSGSIKGTPTKACSASNLTIRATDSDGKTASTTTPFAINIILAPAAPLASYPATAALGGTYTGPAPTAVGGTGPCTWAVASGSLPNGIAMNASTGALSGVPTLNGTYTFTIRSTDSASRVSPVSASITVTVTSTPTPTGSVVPNATAGTAYSSSGLVAGSGGQLPYTWSIASGNLPPGLAINAGNGTISGIPTDVGTFTFAVRLTDAIGNPGTPTGNFSIAVVGVAAPVNPGGSECGPVGTKVGNTLADLPGTNGVVFVDGCWGFPWHYATPGTSLGIPSTYLDMVLPSNAAMDTSMFSFACDGPLVQQTPPLYNPTYGTTTTYPPQNVCNVYNAPIVTPAFLSQLQAAGYQYAIVYPMVDSGNGRALVMWSDAQIESLGVPRHQGIARITGMQYQNQFPGRTGTWYSCYYVEQTQICNTPAGTFPLPYDDSLGGYIAKQTDTQRRTQARGYGQVFYGGTGWESPPLNFAFVVQDDWLRKTATAEPTGSYAAGTVGSPYASAMTGAGTWTVASGSLPPGLSLNANSGIVSGTPLGTGTYSFSVQVTLNQIASALTPTSITIGPATVTTSVNQSHVRQGQTVTGSLSTSLSGASWTVASSPASTWTVTGSTFSGTAPSVAATTAMSVTGTAAISGYSQAGTSASVTVHPAVSITSMPGVAGNAGTAASSTPTVKDLLGTPTYALLQNGSPVANIASLCAGLTFSTTTGTVAGTPSAACSATGLQVKVTDGYDGSTGLSPAWSIAVVYNANNVFWSSGSYAVLPYNRITIRVWGGSGASAGIVVSTPAFTAPKAGNNGGTSTLSGPGISINAPGGMGATGYAGGGQSAAPSGGNSANAYGTAGASGFSSLNMGSQITLTPPAGGTAPGTGGGTGAAPGGTYGSAAVKGVTGNAPGGGSSGATYQALQLAGGNVYYNAWSAGGGGSGSFVESTWTAGQSGAPPVGSTLSFTVGAGGAIGSGATASTVGAAGAQGLVQIIIQ